MVVYYILVIIPGIISLFYYLNKSGKTKTITFFLFFSFLWILLSLRSYEVGVDIKNYKYIFETVRATPWDSLFNLSLESGYVLFNKVIGTFTDNFSVFLAITSFIIIYPLYLLYKKESTDPLLTFVLFINMPNFVMIFSGLRQALAISLSIIAFYSAKKKNFLRFILVTLLAVLFHRSAVIVLLLYPIYHSKITKKWLLFAIPSLLAAFIFNKQLFLFFIRLLGSSYYEKYAEIQSTNAYTMIILFALFLAFSFFMVNDNDLDANTLGLRNIMLLIFAIQLFAPINTMAMRMNYYFLVYIPVLISNTILYAKEKLFLLAKTARKIMILFFVIYFFYNAYTGADILQVFPYRFYWE